MINKDELFHLARTTTDDMLSVYLHVDPSDALNQSAKPGWRIWLKDRLRDIDKQRTETHAEAAWFTVRDEFETYVTTYQPKAKSLVVFMTPERQIIYELPIPLDNAIQYGEPLIAPLLQALDNYKTHLLVLVDREQARFMRMHMGNASNIDTLTIDLDFDWGEKTLMPASANGERALRKGNNRERFEDMIDEHIDRFYRNVAEQIEQYLSENTFDRLIMGGSEQSAQAVREHLSDGVSTHLVGIYPLPLESSGAEAVKRVREHVLDYEHKTQSHLVDTLINTAKANGAAVLGYDNVQRAFQMQQIETLVLSDQIPVTSRNDLVMQALQTNSAVRFVQGDAAASLDDQPGAILHYSLNT